MITEPGIFLDMEPEMYFSDPCPLPSLTQSIAKILIEQSPAHAQLKHPRLRPEKPEWEPEPYVVAKAIGNAAHAAMIGRGKRIVEGTFDDWRTGTAKAVRDLALREGNIPILSEHLRRARAMIKAASYQLDAAGHAAAFRKGQGEVVVIWREGNIWLRTMIDWMVDTTRIYDLKTSGLSCAPHAVIERASTDGWDIQAAFHERGLDTVDPDNVGRRKFIYVAQENDEPYALVPVEISDHDLSIGRAKLAEAILIWRRCIEAGTWPMYPAETLISRPRPWTETKWLERSLEYDDRRRHSHKQEPMLTDLSGM